MAQSQPVAGRIVLAGAYARAAARYWLSIFPEVQRQVDRWRKRAGQIPDATLRALALEALDDKKGNIEGAAAFALLAPRGRRGAAVNAEVAFAALSDYLDTLCEQASEDPIANGRQLHLAQLAALDATAPWVDYYAYHARRDDGGYLTDLVKACRTALAQLPSYPEVAPVARRLAEHAGRFQSLNLTERQGGHAKLQSWARETTPQAGLRWWETAAAANSTLGILALLGVAAQPTLAPGEALAVERAYRPSVEALHTLLDSVVNESEDTAAGQRSLVDYYASPEEAASRLGLIATEAIRGIAELPKAATHAVILAAMVGFYLCPAPATATGPLVSETVLGNIGFLATPTVIMFEARRAIGRVRSSKVWRRWRRAPRGETAGGPPAVASASGPGLASDAPLHSIMSQRVM